MNAYERVMARLRGQAVDRPPNFDIMMTFAAHFIKPAAGALLSGPSGVVARPISPSRRPSDLDILQAISDPYRRTADFGARVEFPDDGLPICKVPLLSEPGDLGQLKRPDPAKGRRMSDRLEAVRPLSGALWWADADHGMGGGCAGGSRPTYAASAHCCWTCTTGQSGCATCWRSVPKWRSAFARAQVAAGADIIGLGDAIGSQVSPAGISAVTRCL